MELLRENINLYKEKCLFASSSLNPLKNQQSVYSWQEKNLFVNTICESAIFERRLVGLNRLISD